MPTVGVFGAIFDNEGRVLCVRHNYGALEWGMPGGRIEPGEDPISALEREITEETGVIAEIAHLVGVYSAPYRDDLVLLFTGRATAHLDWAATTEISDRGFFPSTALPEPMAANPRLRFRHAISHEKGIVCTLASPGEQLAKRSLK